MVFNSIFILYECCNQCVFIHKFTFYVKQTGVSPSAFFSVLKKSPNACLHVYFTVYFYLLDLPTCLLPWG